MDNANTVVIIRTIEELRALKTMRGKLSEFTLVLEMPGLIAEAAQAAHRQERWPFRTRLMIAGFLLALVYFVARACGP